MKTKDDEYQYKGWRIMIWPLRKGGFAFAAHDGEFTSISSKGGGIGSMAEALNMAHDQIDGFMHATRKRQAV